MKKHIPLLLFIFSLLIFFNSLHAQNWNFVQKTGSLDLEPNGNFGISLTLTIDEHYLDTFMFAGAHFAEGGWTGSSQGNAGAAYIYKRDNGNWIEIKKLVSPNTELSGYYGWEVAAAGSYALVGAYNEDHSGLANAGRVYAYYYDDMINEWVLTDVLKIDDAIDGEYFGYTIEMIDDYALIGAYRHPYDENGDNFMEEAGAAYLFKRNNDNTWTRIQKFVAPDRAAEDNFGKYLDIAEGGIVIGSHLKNESSILPQAGAAYAIYCENGCDFESISSADLQKIAPTDPGGLENFGADVSISDDWIVVGQVGENEQPNGGSGGVTGAVYFFHWENGGWVEKQKAYASDFKAQAAFGASISMDSSICVIGATGESTDENGANTVFFAGAAYIFELQDNCEWLEVKKIAGTQRANGDSFASDVDINGTGIVLGASFADSIDNVYTNNGGAAYFYERDSPYNLNFACTSTDIKEIVESSNIILLNNPSPTGFLQLRNNEQYAFPVFLKLSSTNGQVLFTEEIYLENFWEKDFSQLTSGLYYLSLKRKNYTPLVLKWLKI